MDKVAKKLLKQGSCLIWTGCKNSDGYPKINRDGNANTKGHRYVYQKVKGDIPERCVIRHTCDNILCLNPEHLVSGSASENMRDRVTRGRTFKHIPESVISCIRKDLETFEEGYGAVTALAKKHGVSPATIYKLRTGKYKLR